MNVKVLYVTSALGVAGFASLAMAVFVFQPLQPVGAPSVPVQASVESHQASSPRPGFKPQRKGIANVEQVEAGLKRLKNQPKQRAARERVRLVRALPGLPGGKAALRRLAREGSDAEKLVALNVLWARGERQEARQTAEGDRLLAAKITALAKARR